MPLWLLSMTVAGFRKQPFFQHEETTVKYDLLIKGGTVVDPSQELNAVRDVALDLGKVATVGDAIPADSAREVVDARGLIVTPGLIDLHVHSY